MKTDIMYPMADPTRASLAVFRAENQALVKWLSDRYAELIRCRVFDAARAVHWVWVWVHLDELTDEVNPDDAIMTPERRALAREFILSGVRDGVEECEHLWCVLEGGSA